MLRKRDILGAGSGPFPEEAREVLAERVGEALSGAGDRGSAGVTRVSVPVRPVDPFLWLGEQRYSTKLYWSGREDGVEAAAVGVADLRRGEPEELPALQESLDVLLAGGDARTRYYGGLRFDPDGRREERWSAFGGYSFVLPRFELYRDGAEVELVCNLVLPLDGKRREEILEGIEELRFPEGGTGGELPTPISRLDSPDREEWVRGVEAALSGISGTALEKVVLARRTELGFEGELDPLLLAGRLKAATPGCFHFYLQPEAGSEAFVGAPPERLYRRDGRSVRSEAVAGTLPRGESAVSDRELRDRLLGSEKDRREHGYVRESIREELGPLCEELEVEKGTSEMRLASRRHLVSGVRGELREGVTDADLLRALHPTPAVGGYPREEALEEVQELEPFDRGLYAGPVGWIGAGGAEFAVGIRSGLVGRRRLALYSGAGIVSGSDPGAEWEEVEQKISDFLAVLGLSGRE